MHLETGRVFLTRCHEKVSMSTVTSAKRTIMRAPVICPVWSCSFVIVALLSASSITARAADPPQPEPAPPTLKDVRYGSYERNVLDVYKAQRSTPTPVLIHIHGGGWMGGDKFPYDAAPYLKMGISVVSINYRLIDKRRDKDAAQYPAPMQDCARAVQFVRSQSEEWNIDPDRVALTGGSAGAVNCMWIAFHDDMADPTSADPIERLSTRVTCLVPEAGPTTFDPDLVLSRVGGPKGIHGSYPLMFGVKTLAELKQPEIARQVKDASPLELVSSDDPPTYLNYPTPLGGTPLPENTNVMVSIHHAEFGAMIKEKLDADGVENVLQVVGDGKPKNAKLEFLKKHLHPEDE